MNESTPPLIQNAVSPSQNCAPPAAPPTSDDEDDVADRGVWEGRRRSARLSAKDQSRREQRTLPRIRSGSSSSLSPCVEGWMVLRGVILDRRRSCSCVCINSTRPQKPAQLCGLCRKTRWADTHLHEHGDLDDDVLGVVPHQAQHGAGDGGGADVDAHLSRGEEEWGSLGVEEEEGSSRYRSSHHANQPSPFNARHPSIHPSNSRTTLTSRYPGPVQ